MAIYLDETAWLRRENMEKASKIGELEAEISRLNNRISELLSVERASALFKECNNYQELLASKDKLVKELIGKVKVQGVRLEEADARIETQDARINALVDQVSQYVNIRKENDRLVNERSHILDLKIKIGEQSGQVRGLTERNEQLTAANCKLAIKDGEQVARIKELERRTLGTGFDHERIMAIKHCLNAVSIGYNSATQELTVR